MCIWRAMLLWYHVEDGIRVDSLQMNSFLCVKPLWVIALQKLEEKFKLLGQVREVRRSRTTENIAALV